MKISERTLRISAASFLALSFIGVAYFLSGPTFLNRKTANAESTEALLKAYSSKDTDGDGLPDWQEALYGTDPNKAVSNSFGISDGEAAKQGKLTPNALQSQLPGTQQGTTTPLTDADFGGTPTPAKGSITEQFSQEFLEEFFAASQGQPMSADDQQALVTKLLSTFGDKAAKTLDSNYSSVAVHTNTSTDVLTYAAAVEQILRAHDVPADDSHPLPLMEALIENNDTSARPKLVAISSAYSAIATDLRAVSVPSRMVDQHVKLVRAFDVLSKSTGVVASYEKDPLGTLGALKIYQDGSNSLANTLTEVATVILQGGEPANGAPGSLIVFLGRIGKQ